MDRTVDQKFTAAFGRDKTFADGLGGALEGSEELLSTWFMATQVWAAKEPQKMRGYRIIFSHKRANASDPSTGYRAAFFSEGQFDETAKVQDLKKLLLSFSSFPWRPIRGGSFFLAMTTLSMRLRRFWIILRRTALRGTRPSRGT